MSDTRGTLKKVKNKQGWAWMLRYFTTRESDGKRVEHTKRIGLVKDFPGLTVEDAWQEISRQEGASRNDVSSRNLKFTALAEHYIKHDLKDSDDPKAATTIERSEQIIHGILIPRWGKCPAASITTLEIMTWLKQVKNADGSKPANPTLVKIRRVMNLLYKHGQRYGLLPDVNPVRLVKQKSKSGYKPVPVPAEQVKVILLNMRQPERTLTLLVAATGLRISEACGLQWQDVDYENNLINVCRTFINGNVEDGAKTDASEASVPMHPLLAESLREWQKQTPWNKPTDWIFASERLKGKGPRRANMLISDHLRPAAALAGILSYERDTEGKAVLRAGKIIENDPRRFGFHNLRHGLSSLLVTEQITDPKTVQEMLRHSDVKTTLALYTHSTNGQRVQAQGKVIQRFLSDSGAVN